MSPNRIRSPIRSPSHSNRNRCRCCHHRMVGYQKPIRLGQNRYHLVPMIRNLSRKACCHFANRTAIQTPSRTANPIRIPIGCPIRFGSRFGSRFEIHCHLIRCLMFPNRMNR